MRVNTFIITMNSSRSRSAEIERSKHQISEKIRNKGWLCRDFLFNNMCPRGTTCPYMHIRNGEFRPTPRYVCAFFKKGVCLRDQCTFFHGTQLQLDTLHAQGVESYRPQDFMHIVVPPPEYLNADGTIKVPDSASLSSSDPFPPHYPPPGSMTMMQRMPPTLSPPTQPLTPVGSGVPSSATNMAHRPPPQLVPTMVFPSESVPAPSGFMIDGQRAYRVLLVPPNSSLPMPEITYINPTCDAGAAMQPFVLMQQNCLPSSPGFVSPLPHHHHHQMKGVPSAYMAVSPGTSPHQVEPVHSGPPNGAIIHSQRQNNYDGNQRTGMLIPNLPGSFSTPHDSLVALPKLA